MAEPSPVAISMEGDRWAPSLNEKSMEGDQSPSAGEATVLLEITSTVSNFCSLNRLLDRFPAILKRSVPVEETPAAGTSRKQLVTPKFLSSGMEHNLPIGWRFFKVMRRGFHTRLNLPPIMCKKLGEKKAEEAVLTGQNGSFKVKIQEGKDQRLCFTKGWDDFVGQNGISRGDFAVFEHMGSFHFSVVLFDLTCCQKDVHVNPETTSNDRGKNLCTGQENSSCFTTTIKAYNLRRCPYMVRLLLIV
ncbi:PREDICTED: putative B3 domain-containing protein At5g66980 [Ipomoea nil]|uniref:putative B3 domain-containing protein At5g66980 n=1 Tax=Ipomoea nil TaxID=35883 RepID=UPI0009012A0F|nr:PREDICTED: putative B3 domain-containing protein At5g66980 [Ipomoea nil]